MTNPLAERVRDCKCADPKNCLEPVPGYRCRKGEGHRAPAPAAMPERDLTNPAIYIAKLEAYALAQRDALAAAEQRVGELERREKDTDDLANYVTAKANQWRERAEQAESRAAQLRIIVDGCHEAIGEAKESDDDSLADSIWQHITERSEVIAQLQAALLELRCAEQHYELVHGTSAGEELDEARERLRDAQGEADALSAARGEA